MTKPYSLQIAIDVTDEAQALRIASTVSSACRSGVLGCERLIVEAGTPLVKLFGLSILPKLKLSSPGTHLMADLKIADVGRLEASLAFDFFADSVSVLAMAPRSTIRSVLEVAMERSKSVVVDFIGVADLKSRADIVTSLVRNLSFPEDKLVFEFHRGIDEERGRSAEEFFKDIVGVVEYIRGILPASKVAVAGGLTPQLVREVRALIEADIYVVGRYITSNPSLERILEFFD